MTQRRPFFISSKLLFISFIATVAVTSFTVFIFGLDIKRSIYENSLISLSIISVCFFVFVSAGLFFGIRMKENVGDLTEHIKFRGSSGDFSSGDGHGDSASFDTLVIGEGIEGILLSIAFWIAFTILLFLFIVFFETVFIGALIILIAALYWIFYRAAKLVLKNSTVCKGDMIKSARIAIIYTFVYSGWLYFILIVLFYWKK